MEPKGPLLSQRLTIRLYLNLFIFCLHHQYPISPLSSHPTSINFSEVSFLKMFINRNLVHICSTIRAVCSAHFPFLDRVYIPRNSGLTVKFHVITSAYTISSVHSPLLHSSEVSSHGIGHFIGRIIMYLLYAGNRPH
jgi:hypothetical protein